MTHAYIYKVGERWGIAWTGALGVARAGVTYRSAREAKEQVLACAPLSAIEGTLMLEIEGGELDEPTLEEPTR